MKYTCLFCVFLLTHLFTSHAQEASSGNFRIQNYSADEYGAHFQNWNAVQDPRGVMYFANNSNVLEFDGKQWQDFRIGAKSLSVASSKDGKIFVGGIGIIGYLKTNENGQKEGVSLVEKIPEEHREFQNIWRIAATDEGAFFRDRNRLFHYHDDTVDVIPAPSHPFLYSIGNDLFTPDSTGIKIKVGRKFETLPHTEGLNSTAQSLVHVVPAPDGKILLITRYNGVYSYDLRKVREAKKENERFDQVAVSASVLTKLPTVFDFYLKKYQAYCVDQIHENLYAIGTLGGGIVLMDAKGGLVGILNKSRGLIDNRVYYVYADHQQNLWAATNNGISHIYTSTPFRYYGAENGLDGSVLHTVRHKDVLYASTYNALYYLPPYELQAENDLPKFEKLNDQPSWAFYNEGENLFAGGFNELYQIKGTQKRKIYEAPDVIYSIGASPRLPNHLFVGSRAGIRAVETSSPIESATDGWMTAKEVTDSLLTSYEYIMSKAVTTSDGSIWFTTEGNGVLHLQFPSADYSKAIITRLDTLNGFPSLHFNNVFEHEGTVFAVTEDGIYQLENRDSPARDYRFSKTSKFPPIPEKNKSTNYADIGGSNLYISSSLGPARLDLTKDSLRWESALFQHLDAIVWKIYIDQEGIVWLNSNNGLIRYDSKQEKNYRTNYRTLIRRVTLNSDSTVYYGNRGEEVQGSKNTLVFPYEDNNIKFEYTAAFYENPEQLQYQYFLKGFDESPSDWSAETKKEYTNLPEGSYEFVVRAKNVFGVESQSDHYHFKIKTPWYRSIFAYLLYAAILLLIIYIAVKLNSKRLEKEKRQLELVVAERTAEITTQNEELQQQAEEISAQRDQIEEQNKTLVHVNEEISEQKEQIERSFNNISVLSNIGQEVTSTLNTREIIGTVYGHINELMKAEAFGIGVYNKPQQQLDFDGFIENGEEIPFSSDKLSDREAFSVRCFLNKERIVINDFEQEKETTLEPSHGGVPSSIMYMPLLSENEAIGVITVQSFEKNAYDENDQIVLSTLASYVAIAISNANSYEIIEEKNEHITDSIRYARTIQRAVLPKIHELQASFQDAFILYRPKDIVSGDFFWHAQIDKEHGVKKCFVAVADCTGHGVPGAFMSMIGNTLLNEIIVVKNIHDTAVILEELDASIKVALKQEEKENSDGMDIGICCLTYQPDGSVSLQFSGAKRPLHWFRTEQGTLEKVDATRRGIGGMEFKKKDFVAQSREVQKGDILYLQTDGLADQATIRGKKIGSKNILIVLEQNANLPLDEQQKELESLLDNAQGDLPQRDDIALLGIRV